MNMPLADKLKAPINYLSADFFKHIALHPRFVPHVMADAVIAHAAAADSRRLAHV